VKLNFGTASYGTTENYQNLRKTIHLLTSYPYLTEILSLLIFVRSVVHHLTESLKRVVDVIVQFHREKDTELTDAMRVLRLAQEEDVSEYEIFVRAGRVFNIKNIDSAFAKYLFTEELTWWMRHYIRFYG
jgi:hypothetical protein